MKISSGSEQHNAFQLKRIVVDANPILSGLIKGAAWRAFWSPQIREFATTEFTLKEVHEYLPGLAAKSERPEEILLLDLKLLPLKVHHRKDYQAAIEEARKRIGQRDPNDVDLLALALKLKAPIWSNDEDFKVADVEWLTTAELLKKLEG